jgi:hypothetical protein
MQGSPNSNAVFNWLSVCNAAAFLVKRIFASAADSKHEQASLCYLEDWRREKDCLAMG